MNVTKSAIGYAYDGINLSTSGMIASFIAAGLYWIFLIDLSNSKLGFITSTNNTTWSAITDITGVVPGNYGVGGQYSVCFDGTYGHIVWSFFANAVNYLRFTPNSDGTITIDPAGIQSNVITGFFFYPEIITDKNGYVWILAYSSGVGHFISKNKNISGTWTADTGFPLQLNNSTGGYSGGGIAALHNAESVVVVYGDTNGLYSNQWVSGVWVGAVVMTGVNSFGGSPCLSYLVADNSDNLYFLTQTGVGGNIGSYLFIYKTSWSIVKINNIRMYLAFSINLTDGTIWIFGTRQTGSANIDYMTYKNGVGITGWTTLYTDTGSSPYVLNANLYINVPNQFTVIYDDSNDSYAIKVLTFAVQMPVHGKTSIGAQLKVMGVI